MAIDMDRIVRAAAEAVLEEQDSGRRSRKPSGGRKRKFLSAPRAILIGAGVVTAGRLAARLRGGDLVERLQERLSDVAGLDDEDELDQDADLDEDVGLDEDEPYDEADEDYDEDVDDEEPEEEDEEERSASSSASSR
jgi:hypothetical protein